MTSPDLVLEAGAVPSLPRDPTLMSGADVVRALESHPRDGLSEVEAARRLADVGPNRLQSAAPVSSWRRLAAQFADPLVYLLIGATVVSLLAWASEGAHGLPVEAAVIAAIVLANGVLGYVQERQAERAVAALERMAAPTARVVRGGREQDLDAEGVVPGDLLVLGEGDAVTADGRLLEADYLTVAEAALTGESEPSLKASPALPRQVPLGDRSNMVFTGTSITRGRGVGVVTATGMATEIGRIAALLERTVEEPTPLQREVGHLGRTLGVAVVAIAVLVVVAVLLTSDVQTLSDLVDVLLLGVSLAVAAVPEGLPAILTVVLALGVQRMARQNAIVKKLSSVETLGSASVICTDKTGTLTQNEMTIVRIATRSGEVMITGSGYRPEGHLLVDGRPLETGPLRSEVRAVLGGGSSASDALLEQHDGTWTIHGDPTEAAFLVAERKLGTAERRVERFSRRGAIPFSSERKLMSTVVADGERENQIVIMTKGAPGLVLARCSRERIGSGEEPLTDARRDQISAVVDRLADAGLRTLAVAYRPLDAADAPEPDASLEDDLVLAGVVGMMDPPRSEAPAAIAEAQGAGVRVVMITGDHERTARRIAADLGLIDDDGEAMRGVVSGAVLDTMDEATLSAAATSASVFARVSPEHKLRIVKALKDNGEIVAMTGDGVNDAPALRAADIGVAMGIAGTDVSKEAANMILADDNFATIVAAIREGRAIFANIRKFLRYLLSSNIGEVVTVFVGVVAAPLLGLGAAGGIAVPLLATQILWINLLTDSAPALGLGFEPPHTNVMQRPPRQLSDRVIDRSMWLGVLYIGLVMAAATLLTIDAQLPGGLVPGSRTIDEARTMGFTVLVLAQLFNALNARSSTDSAFRRPLANPYLLAGIALSLALQVLVVHAPFMNEAFSTVPLSGADWMVCLAMGSSVLWADELRKVVARRIPASPGAGHQVTHERWEPAQRERREG